MAINLASAYITIMPDTSKLAGGIKKSLAGLDAEGKTAGKKLADGMSNAMKGKGKDAGGDLGKEITDAMGRAVKGEGTKVGKIIGDDVSKSLDGEAEKAGKSFGQKLSSAMGKAGSSVANFSNKFKVHAGVALGGLTALGKGAADYAAEAEQSYGAVESIFGEHAAKINDLSKTAADSVGLSGREYREQASYMGAMLKNLGTPMEELGGKSADLVAMGADLAATFGGPTSDAVSALGAVLRGETDPIERYGISIKQADINAKMAEMGMDGLTGEAEKQARAQATLALLTEQSASAQGQFARETDTAAHKSQVARAKIDDAKETIGTALLPVVAQLSEMMAKVAEQVGKHPRLFLSLAGAVGAVSAAIVGIATVSSAVSALGGMAKIASVASKAMAGLKVAMAAVTGPVGLIVAGIAAVVAGLTLFFTKTETGKKLWASFTQFLGQAWDWIVGKFQAGIEWITSTFGPVFSQIGQVISGAWDATVEKVSGAMARVKEIISGALTFWQTGETTDFAAALGISEDSPIFTALTFLRDKFIEVKDFAIEAWGLMQEKWAEFTTGFGQFYETWIAPVVEFFVETFTGLKDFAIEAWQTMQDKWSEFTTGFGEFYQTWIVPVIDAFGTAFSAIVPVVTAAWDGLGSVISTVWNGVIKPVFDAFMQVASVVFPAIAAIVKTVVGTAFRIMGDVISTVWNSVIRPAWDVMRSVFGIVADVLTGNFSNLGNRFSELGQRIRALVVGVFTSAFNLLKSVVTNSLNAAKAIINIFKQAVVNMVNIAKGKINSLVQGFREMPGKIKAAFAGAGSWLLDAGRSIISGLAQGVRNAAGMVENAVRAVIPDNIERFVPGLHLGGVVPAFARGGVLPSVPGFTKNDRDPILGWSKEKKQPIARVEPGEFIVNRDATKKYGRLLAAINGGKLNGKMGDMGLPGYANGGVVGYDELLRFFKGQSVRGQQASRSLEGAPYVFGGSNWGDCSSTQGQGALFTVGKPATHGRFMATMDAASKLSSIGFRRGRSSQKNAYEIAFFNGGPWGGHTSGTLYDTNGKGTNVEMGGGRGNGQIGGAAAGARHSQYTDIYWHPLKSAAGQALSDGKIVGTSTKGVTVDAGEGNKFQAEAIDWGEASQYGTDWEKENKRRKNLRRWSAGIFDTGGILKPGNIAINASGKPERVLDPRLTVAVEKVAETSPAVAKSMDNLAKVNWDNVGAQVSEGWSKRMDGYQSFAGAQARSIQRGDKIGDYLKNIGLSEGLGLADQIGGLIGIDGIKSTFGGVVGAFEDMEDAAVAEVDASDAVKQAEKNLAKARKEGSPEDVQKAEEELTKARGAVQLAARATGQAQVAMMVELASLAINLIKGVFKFIEGKIQDVMQAHVSAFKAVGSAMESVGKLDAEVLKLRESVTGLVIDQAMAQIELAAAARNVRIAQMDGVTSQLQATKTLAEAQAAFDEQRQADMRLAAMGYDDLSLAYDRFRWGMLDANGDVMDSLAAWSDESHALYSELLAAQVNQQLVEKQAQQANLEAAYKHTLAAIELNDVTSSLEVAAKKLAVASGHAFGMDQVGATVGQRYSELMGEKAALKADQASLKTWLNPVNWFTTMPANQRRIKQIDQQLKQLQAMPEFQDFDRGTRRDIDRAVKSAGWMGFFGAGDKVDEMIKNSALGDASRALDQMEFENRLIDMKAEQDTLRRKVEKNLAEVEYRKQLDPLETLIAGLEQERESNKTWAEYWRTDNENIRKSLADLAGHQADYAGELKQMSAEPNKVVQISGDNFSREQLEAAMAELGVRVERLERPRASASQVVASRR